jgi:phosphonate transport system substrate-binding protein
MKNMTFRLMTLILIVWFGLSDCNPALSDQAVAQIDLNDLQPLPSPPQSETVPLQVAIAAVISPENTVQSYAPLLAYLEKQLGRKVEVVQRRTYAEVNDLLKTGDVDLAFVCTSAYIAGKKDFGMQLLVAPVVNGITSYRSQLIVSVDNSATSIADLRGQVFAFTDPMSFTGRVYPTYLLQELGETPATFFEKTFFTYSHDDAIRAVADGLADGASVDSLVLNFALEKAPDLQGKIKIIHTSPPFGIPPVVVRPNLSSQLRDQLETIFLEMHQNPEGLSALQALDIDRFTVVSPDLYDSVDEITTYVVSDDFLP